MFGIYRFFRLTAWAMIIVGMFTFVTGFLSFIGVMDPNIDKIAGQAMFEVMDSGLYFMICGIIHIAAGAMGLARLRQRLNGPFCTAFCAFTLGWQFASFIYLITLYYISVRLALMVILPIIYLVTSIIAELRMRIDPFSIDMH